MNAPATPHISLEQWRALIAVVDAGGYAQAAEILHKSQSAVTYAVQKLEAVLGVKAFEIRGRKAVLTPTGQLLYRRAHSLLDEAGGLEKAARSLAAGWEPEIRIAVEVLFPTWLILDCLHRFGAEAPDTRIELIESVISGTQEALLTGQANLAITNSIPPGFTGDHLIRLRTARSRAERGRRAQVLIPHKQEPRPTAMTRLESPDRRSRLRYRWQQRRRQ